MQFDGKITFVGETQEVGEKKIQKRDFVVEEQGAEYPNSMCFTLFGENKVGYVKAESVGMNCTVDFNTKTSEYNGRYFTNINAWKVKVEKGDLPDTPQDDSLPF